MPLLNYTTTVPVNKTVAQIHGLLVEAGARQSGTDYDGAGMPVGILFVTDTVSGPRGFALPVNAARVQAGSCAPRCGGPSGVRLRRDRPLRTCEVDRPPIRRGDPLVASVHERKTNAGPRFDVRYRPYPGAKEILETFSTKRDAKLRKSIIEADLARGSWRDPRVGEVTFTSWVEQCQVAAVHKRATTAARDRTVLRTHFLPMLGPMPLNVITPDHLRALVARMAETLKPSTVRTDFGDRGRIGEIQPREATGVVAARRGHVSGGRSPAAVSRTAKAISAPADACARAVSTSMLDAAPVTTTRRPRDRSLRPPPSWCLRSRTVSGSGSWLGAVVHGDDRSGGAAQRRTAIRDRLRWSTRPAGRPAWRRRPWRREARREGTRRSRRPRGRAGRRRPVAVPRPARLPGT